MRLARIVGGIGRTLIGVGLLLLLFVAYQLWGTSIQEARAQNRLGNEFEAARLKLAKALAEKAKRN